MAGIYIHIPYCRHKCSYCNFYSTASATYRNVIADMILTELDLRKSFLSEEINSIYFGGGTPSVLPVSDINKILKSVYNEFDVSPDVEITFEANPDDLDINYLSELKKIGINRISIGIQSFFEQDLAYLERVHKAERIPEVMNAIIQSGYDNINADLIYGIPGQTELMVEQNLNWLTEYPVNHISAYALTVEPGTALQVQIKKKIKPETDEAVLSSHFLRVSKLLTKTGFEHYEISNFAIAGKYSKHNTSYWFQEPYLGLGPSAHSYDGYSRRWNANSVQKYIDTIKQNKLREEVEILSLVQKFNEFIMLRLRTQWGIDMQEVARKFGAEWHNDLRKAVQQIQQPDKIKFKNNKLILTPLGFLYADGLASELFRD
ncbi:MAG: radical SAM family heme chaperone HemW [Bacteroidales bacterium]|nr:radical SAM family heme chaperone HemW [Bacteroidales bacterium]